MREKKFSHYGLNQFLILNSQIVKTLTLLCRTISTSQLIGVSEIVASRATSTQCTMYREQRIRRDYYIVVMVCLNLLSPPSY